MVEKHPNYWMIKCRYMEYQLNAERLRAAAFANEETMMNLLEREKLDPKIRWVFNDETETITKPEESNDKSIGDSKT